VEEVEDEEEEVEVKIVEREEGMNTTEEEEEIVLSDGNVTTVVVINILKGTVKNTWMKEENYGAIIVIQEVTMMVCVLNYIQIEWQLKVDLDSTASLRT
jgi:hypothetical protein